jgi:hypothetical protein
MRIKDLALLSICWAERGSCANASLVTSRRIVAALSVMTAGGRGSRQASEVRLPTAGGDDRVRTSRGGITQQELKLSQLIAAAAERHEIVTLGIDLDAIRRRTQGILDAMKTPNRSHPVQQAPTRQRIKGLGKGHDHDSIVNGDTLPWLPPVRCT